MRRNDTGLFRQRVPMRPDLRIERRMRPGTRGGCASTLAAEIARAGGWIGFERYMDIALYAPGLGYYSAGAHKLGTGRRFHHRAGDFAAVRRMRRAAMCRRAASRWRRDRYWRSARAAAASRWTCCRGSRRSEHCLSAIASSMSARICAIGSAARSASAIPHLAGRVEWIEAPPEAQFDGVILANEVLDALPVARFRWHRHLLRGARRGNRARSVRLGAASRERRRRARCATRSRRQAADGRTATCRSIARGSPPGPGKSRGRCARGLVLWVDYGLPRAAILFSRAARRDAAMSLPSAGV